MQDKRDQLQAHLFVVGRLVSAVVSGKADPPEAVLRRSTTGALGGIAIGLLALLAVGLIGYIRPGHNTSWRTENAIVVEKETGNRYLYTDGQLHPVLNVTSALLDAGDSGGVHSVSAKSLSGVGHGAPIGIAGAPDWLPSPSDLVTGSWQVCGYSGPGRSGQSAAGAELAVDDAIPITRLGPTDGLLVQGPDGATFLVSGGQRFPLSGSVVLTALGYRIDQALPVTAAWLNAVPLGPAIYTPDVPGRGTIGPIIDSAPTRVGELFTNRSATGDQTYYLLLGDGLLRINQTEATIELGDPNVARAYPGRHPEMIDISAAALSTTAHSNRQPLGASWPALVPRLPTMATGLRPCLSLTFNVDRVTITPATTTAAPVVTTVNPAANQAQSVDAVRVPPGRGVLVSAQATARVSTGTYYVITDRGIRYPIPNSGVAGTLGFGGVTAMPIPTSILSLVPLGPALDPAQAKVAHESVPFDQPK